jgi:hypothetical protein
VPIQEAYLKDRLKVEISYSQSFEEFLACTEAGMDWHRWNKTDDYDVYEKALVIVGYRMRHLIEAHVSDAQNAAQRKAAKRKKQ